MLTGKRLWPCLIITLTVMAAAVWLRLSIGAGGLGWPQQALFLQLRGQRVVVGATVGAALALAGVALQALLKNPLAEPFVLGLSTGAGAGVMAQSVLFYWLGWAIGQSYVGAAIGSLVSLLVVFALSRRSGVIDPLGLLLTGVILSTMGGALIMAFNALAGPGDLRDDLMQWMMGNLNQSIEGGLRAVVLGLVGLSWGVLLWQSTQLDRMCLSDDEARTMGVGVDRLRVMLLLIGSVLAATAVVLSGPVAFVGLVAPHVARLLAGPRHLSLVLLAPFLGAALVVLADCVSELMGQAFNAGRLPIGVFTALLGGPIFLVLIRMQMGNGRGS